MRQAQYKFTVKRSAFSLDVRLNGMKLAFTRFGAMDR